VRTAAPLLGADTEEICLELLGYSRERIDGLREAGVLN
jgi:crotonobetainyl-CoA:carnitine CoA-transferase CaiB-like acyl-CoA transferase